jgi:alpha-2-macroglobulin
MKRVAVSLALFIACAAAQAQKLTIVKAGPVGEVATLAEANEIRAVFSEPMVAIGKVPLQLVVPWFHITPAVGGTFRWSGTTTLIFTPDPKKPLPFATQFDVTIDADAKALSGDSLGQPYSFSFITPTIQLRSTNWYRKDPSVEPMMRNRSGRFDAPVVVLLRFNQPVDPKVIVQHLQLRTKAHPFKDPAVPALDRLTPAERDAFEAKKAMSRQVAASDGAMVLSFLADDWDKKTYPLSSDLVVLETKPNIAPDTFIQVFLDSELARGPKNVRTGRTQEFTIELPHAFFVDDVRCVARCNPELWNTITFRVPVKLPALRKALTVTDITDPAKPVTLAAKIDADAAESENRYATENYSLDEFPLLPAHTYLLRIDPSLLAADQQPLGYPWAATVENWHKTAFTSFGDGHGVWESSGGSVLPFYARNFTAVKQWLAPVSVDQVVPAIMKLTSECGQPPPGAKERKLAPAADKIQSYGLDVRSALNASGHGIVSVGVAYGTPIANADVAGDPACTNVRNTIVQVTNLGISVKDSPQNTLVLVTRLDNGAPVAAANVTIRAKDNKVVWSGVTDAYGLAIAGEADLRETRKEKKEGDNQPDGGWSNAWEALDQYHFFVFAEKDGDVAYAASNWTEGISPWDFDLPFNISESLPLLRGTIFTDRGVYKLGEEVHAKAVLRSDTPKGMQLLPAGTKVEVTLTDSRDQQVDKRTVSLSEWSSSEWTVKIPSDAPLGTYRYKGEIQGQLLSAGGEFLVAAYRRPEFRVDASLTAPASIAGATLAGKITGRYLFGSPMSRLPVKWSFSKSPLYDVPRKIDDRFPPELYTFLGFDAEREREVKISSKEQKLDTGGELKLQLPTDTRAGWPYDYKLEGEVTDVSRQRIAGRTSFRVDPAPWYIGVKNLPFFTDVSKGVDTAFVAVALDGVAVPGVNVSVELHQVQWNSVRRAVGNGFYTWDTERKEVAAGTWSVTTQAQPVPLHIPVASGGQYNLIATAKDEAGHSTTTRVWFYAAGAGYTAWERYDHNRIDLVPEKKNLRPGETARIMIKSPWEHATALLTTEREGVRTWKQFELTSTQQTVTVPITEADIPNVYVSVLLVKGRSKEAVTEDASDPGKPSFRLGYVELKVEDAAKRLKVDVKANRDEYRPASKAKIEVEVRDQKGSGSRSEVTLWAVDYGVLSLTGYKTPDVLQSIYLEKSLQVVNEDSRQKIISRRVLTPKGATDGGGGGRDAGPGMLRKDFRVLAFWLGSITTDIRGRARTEVTLPESLTTYRIMAVAADKQSRFGWGQNEIRINKPLLLTPTFPRFLAVGDKALFGAVIHSQLTKKGTASITIRSLDPDVLEITGQPAVTAEVDAKGSAEVRFNALARGVGSARVQISVSMLGESDAFEDSIPVRVLVSPETFAAYGSVGAGSAAAGTATAETARAKETLEIPSGIVPAFGGLHIDLASTAMVGLGEGAQYLVAYPYGCAEQRASAALALVYVSELGGVFKLPGVDAAAAKKLATATVGELPKFQCASGGFAYWNGECASVSPYLTSYVLHVLQIAKRDAYPVDQKVLDGAYGYLEAELAKPRPDNESWWPAYTAWQAFAVKTLVEGGRNEDSHITRLMTYVDRMPVFGLSHLADALIAKGEGGPRLANLQRRISNAILPEGGFAHVEELADPELMWFWNSNVRTTAMVLGTLVRSGSDQEIATRMVRWMMKARKRGRWGNTQENAWAMESLVDYYRKYESVAPDFTALASIGSETVEREEFRGRSAEAKSRDWSMQDVLRIAPADSQVPVTFERQGTGTLFYALRLRYARSVVMHDPLDQGFALERHYALQNAKADQSSFKAGDLIKVTLRVRNTKERRFVAVTDPIPAGTEPVESWFATTASDIAEQQAKADRGGDDWLSWWRYGGFDHVERHDDRVNLFATRLSEGPHEFTYLLRATTAGTFITAPLHAEEMYEPEVFGRTATSVVEVRP